MNIVITGGAGFIGSHLADRLIESSYLNKVFILDNLITGRMDNVNPEAIFYNIDISDTEKVEEFFRGKKIDIVIHAAATGADPNNWKMDTMSNVLGTVNIVKQSLLCRIERLIYFQTSLCYGTPQTNPITLDHPINPTNSYSITKTAAERYIAMSGLNFISFRLANCYGPRNLAGAVPTFYHRLSQGQSCFVYNTRRDFVYIEDLVNIVMRAVCGYGEKGYYHISTGKDYPILDIYNIVANQLGIDTKPEIKPMMKEDVESILLDPSVTKKVFEVIPRTLLDYGIRKAINWYKEHGITETYTHLPKEK